MNLENKNAFNIFVVSIVFSIYLRELTMCMSVQSCLTLFVKLSVHGIFQARILEWVAISFCRGSSGPRD